MKRLRKIYFHLVGFIQEVLLLFSFKIPFIIKLQNKRNACFFCGNATIGDNVITLSLIKPYALSHKVNKICYFGGKKYLQLLKPLYDDYNGLIVWKEISTFLFNKIISNRKFLNEVITICNNHENAFHSIFYLKETIPHSCTVIEYQMQKMNNAQCFSPFVPTVPLKAKKNQIVVNIDSQTIYSAKMTDIANAAICFCNENNIKVLVNSQSSKLKGQYELIYPNIQDFLSIVESSLLFLTIRTGLADVSVGTTTPFLIIYDELIDYSFSLNMWKIKNKRILEIIANDYSNDLLYNLLKFDDSH